MKISKIISISVPVLTGVGGILSMTVIAYLLQTEAIPLWVISKHKILNFTFTMQFMALPISFLAIVVMFVFDRDGFKKFFRFRISLSDKTSEWNVYGPLMAVLFTMGTALFMSVSVISEKGSINSSFFASFRISFLCNQRVVGRDLQPLCDYRRAGWKTEA